MSTTSALRVIKSVEFLLAARRGAPRLPGLPADIAPQTDSEAWAIQDLLFTYLATHPGGWKVSMPDAHSGRAAPLMARDLAHSDSDPARFEARTSGTTQFGIEPEICLRMAEDLYPLPAGSQYDRATVLAAVASAHAAIEVCVCRFADFFAAPPLDQLADNLMNEGLIIGPACNDWRGRDLEQIPLKVRVDGQEVHSAHGGHPLVDPLLPLVWLANHLSARKVTLRAGTYVTTGSYNGLRLVKAGSRCDVIFDGVGPVSVQF
ncbi:MAG: fumarylacetoacetate hydrolase family protein [Steroidobacteraceae bacterium]